MEKTAPLFTDAEKVENSSSRNHTAYHCRMYTEVSGRCKSSITESDLLDRTGTGNWERWHRFLYKCCRKKHLKRWNHHNIEWDCNGQQKSMDCIFRQWRLKRQESHRKRTNEKRPDLSEHRLRYTEYNRGQNLIYRSTN